MPKERDAADIAAMKAMGATLIERANGWRRRQVGWIPFLAFWIPLAYVFYPDSTPPGARDSFHAAGMMLILLAVLALYYPVFCAVAWRQWRTYRRACRCGTQPG
ncbi:hypothetical protein [Achromobacter xylosoxidans]|uniref:hypothetical protein n=1 Tax=Alcaligenes xylosoxydans xylosoxydans TaxID=85698 RepID=UPI001F13D60C|nr:hypothetical protein [Achromobacter xylosoxidans]